MYIEQINSPEDLKKLTKNQLDLLAKEMRDTLLIRLSKRGGHFGPNFGIVEATIALHYVFDSPMDKIVFDISHQSYPHKMLTGRKEAYLFEEHYEDVTGFTNPKESTHDYFTVGHTSTSVSLACGLAVARDLGKEPGNVIAVIGDGSLSGGEALEGFNFAGEMESNLIIVVNDNDMSIAENHGGIYKNLKELRDSKGKSECNLFKSMGLDYIYVNNGNDIMELIEAFQTVKDTKKPIVVHINTIKGNGYKIAEINKENWHYAMPFDIETGQGRIHFGEDYSSITAEYLLEKMKRDDKVVAITAGTPGVLGFTKNLREQVGKQFIDVGIAEETAVAIASGIATGGGKPVFGVYSTFVQRTYDQLSQDLCINNSPATIITYQASVYGMNDVTHLGIFDIPMMANIPNLVYLAPTTKEEYLTMLDWSIEQSDYPVAIRLPGGDMISKPEVIQKDFGKLNVYEVSEHGEKVAIIGLGTFYTLAQEAAKQIKESLNINATVINPYYITGLDEALLHSLIENHEFVITLEDGVLDGGFGEKIARFYGPTDMRVMNYGLKKEFLDRYDVQDVLEKNHLTASQIAIDVKEQILAK